MRFFLPIFWLSLMPGFAADPIPARRLESQNQSGQYHIISSDDLLNQVIMDWATETRQRLAPYLGLPRKWRYPVNLQILPGSPDVSAPPPTLFVTRRQKQLNFEIRVTSPPPIVTTELLRALVTTCVYEKILEAREDFAVSETLPIPPLWVTEGALQWVMGTVDWVKDERYDSWERVIRRALNTGKAPTVQTVAAWEELSPDPIQRAWQQAFCFRLFQIATQRLNENQAFSQWIAGLDRPTDSRSFLPSFIPTQDTWRRAPRLMVPQAQDLLLSWEQTLSRLTSEQALSLEDPANKKITIATLKTLRAVQHHPGLQTALDQKITALTRLELIAYFSWRPIIATYRSSLTQLNQPKPKTTYEELIRLAETQTKQLIDLDGKITDYLNWFEITQPMERPENAVSRFFVSQRQFELQQPRPMDPTKREILIIEQDL